MHHTTTTATGAEVVRKRKKALRGDTECKAIVYVDCIVYCTPKNHQSTALLIATVRNYPVLQQLRQQQQYSRSGVGASDRRTGWNSLEINRAGGTERGLERKEEQRK